MPLTLPIDMQGRNWAITTAEETLSSLQPVHPNAIVVQIELRGGEEAARIVGALIPEEQKGGEHPFEDCLPINDTGLGAP